MSPDIVSRFEDNGFAGLQRDELEELVTALEQRAASTGLAAPLFIAEAVRFVRDFLIEHDEYGGVRVDFLDYLNKLVTLRAALINTMSRVESAGSAKDLRDEIQTLVDMYTPEKLGGL